MANKTTKQEYPWRCSRVGDALEQLLSAIASGDYRRAQESWPVLSTALQTEERHVLASRDLGKLFADFANV